MSKRVERVTSEAAIDELLADSDGEDPLVISESEEEEESKSQAKAKKPSLFQRAKKRVSLANTFFSLPFPPLFPSLDVYS